jgi:hypothetical protein
LCKAWEVHGEPALTAAAFLHPMEFVRVVANLMPKEMGATVTANVRLERMSDAELTSIIAAGIQSGMDPELPPEDPPTAA